MWSTTCPALMFQTRSFVQYMCLSDQVFALRANLFAKTIYHKAPNLMFFCVAIEECLWLPILRDKEPKL